MKNLTCLHNGRSQITKQKLGGGAVYVDHPKLK
jgi:hypothetical protein